MRLQGKILAIVLLVIGLYTALDYGIQNFFVVPSFIALERNRAESTMRSCIAELKKGISSLDKLTKACAASEQICKFVKARNSGYSHTGLSIESFSENNLDLICICDTESKFLAGEIRDPRTKHATQLDKLPSGRLPETNPLLGNSVLESPIAGVVVAKQGPILIACHPIRENRHDGPICGALIMGRFLNESVLEVVMARLPGELKMWTLPDKAIPLKEREILDHVTAERQFHVREEGDNLLHVYALFPDIQGRPALLMRADIHRDIGIRGVTSIARSSLLSNFAAGLSVMLILLLLLRRTVVAPIEKLTKHMVAIGKSEGNPEDTSRRISMQRKDEVGTLAQEFDHMVEQLSKARDKLLKQSYYKGMVEMARKAADDARKRALELEDLNKRLEKANSDLRDFAYVTSHDLKAPLRAIATLARWISTDYADKFDDEGKEKVNLLVSRVDRMYNLIDDILRYSWVEHVREKHVPVDLNELVSTAIDSVAPPENIEITVEHNLPTIMCDQTQIEQVFQNLLSNAVKYIDKPHGKISIGCAEEGQFWKLSVTDNGPGIDKKYFGKIFRIFQTLSPSDDVQATGVGLSIVKKIVELYGGRVWVESKVGEGSTFFFTLPKQESGCESIEFEAIVASQ